jgi:hypothetical protein
MLQMVNKNGASTGLHTSATNAKAMIADDSRAVFEVQADASVTAGDLYGSQNFAVTLGTGSTFTGISGHGIAAATRIYDCNVPFY